MRETRLLKANTGETIVNNLEIADNFATRFVGLMGRKGLADNAGLLIEPCSGVHCWFMRFPIDVVYVNNDWEVIKVDAGMKPWRMGRPVRGSRRVIELASGEAERLGLEAGTPLQLDD